jgi:hypothetical protein
MRFATYHQRPLPIFGVIQEMNIDIESVHVQVKNGAGPEEGSHGWATDS